jgi:hypothetical protein
LGLNINTRHVRLGALLYFWKQLILSRMRT